MAKEQNDENTKEYLLQNPHGMIMLALLLAIIAPGRSAARTLPAGMTRATPVLKCPASPEDVPMHFSSMSSWCSAAKTLAVVIDPCVAIKRS